MEGDVLARWMEDEVFAGADAARARVDLLIEVPHGADRAADFEELAGQLRGPLRADLRDFFFVNTDVGASALARATAERLVELDPTLRVRVIHCRIPRTLVDCNRVLDFAATSALGEVPKVTPGLPPWIVDPEDERVLRELYDAYHRRLAEAYEAVCAEGDGLALMLHSYAPRSLDVPVDDEIVERLRREYAPDRIERWPLRSPVDLIATDPQGDMLASAALVEAVEERLSALELEVTTSACYSLLPGTVAERVARAYPGRTLCIEFRRDLLVREFTPFAEMPGDPERIAPLARALAAASATALTR